MRENAEAHLRSAMTKLSLAVLLTLASVAAAGAQPTIRAVAATGNPSGAILMNSWQGYHALAVAAVNAGSQTVQAEVHVTVNGPGGVLLCETEPVTGECLTSLERVPHGQQCLGLQSYQ